MGLTENLQYAKLALRHVLYRLDGAANWDQYRGGPSYEGCSLRGRPDCERLMTDLDIRVYARIRQENWGIESDGATIAEMQTIASSALRHRAGNCREYSAVAFVYLHELGRRPIDWMALNEDHAFVALGRAEGSRTLLDWGPHAVICDPWAAGFTRDDAYGVYPATQFRARMNRIVPYTGGHSMFRSR